MQKWVRLSVTIFYPSHKPEQIKGFPLLSLTQPYQNNHFQEKQNVKEYLHFKTQSLSVSRPQKVIAYRSPSCQSARLQTNIVLLNLPQLPSHQKNLCNKHVFYSRLPNNYFHWLVNVRL